MISNPFFSVFLFSKFSSSSSSSLKFGCLCHQEETAKLFKAKPFNKLFGYIVNASLNLALASIKLPFNKYAVPKLKINNF